MTTTYDTLYRNHPDESVAPCTTATGARSFENQCAIRMGVALTSSGFSLTGYRGAFCWHGHGRTHPLRVEELIHWLGTSSARAIVNAPTRTKRPKKGSINPVDFNVSGDTVT
jgi:hypothetical protein